MQYLQFNSIECYCLVLLLRCMHELLRQWNWSSTTFFSILNISCTGITWCQILCWSYSTRWFRLLCMCILAEIFPFLTVLLVRGIYDVQSLRPINHYIINLRDDMCAFRGMYCIYFVVFKSRFVLVSFMSIEF